MAPETPQNTILRVAEADRVIKLKHDSMTNMRKLETDCDFSLKYECLVDIEELPQKACVHISLTQDSSSVASTDAFSDVSSPERLSP